MPAIPRPTLPPNTAPSGRGVNPATGRIGALPGGMDYLAGLGPAPAGLSAADAAWTPPAPVIHGVGLQGPGMANILHAYQAYNPKANFGDLLNVINPNGSQDLRAGRGQVPLGTAPSVPRGTIPNLINPSLGPFMGAGMNIPYASGMQQPASGGMGAVNNIAPWNRWNSGGQANLSSVRPQGAFQLGAFPTTPTAGFSTASDPWGLGAGANYAQSKP